MTASHSAEVLVTNDHRSPHAIAAFVEPLAEFIAASDRPREALLSALEALFDEVQGTHRATLMHLARTQADSLGLAL